MKHLFAAVLASSFVLVGCGGGGSASPAPSPPPVASPAPAPAPTALQIIDVVVGTGTVAVAGNTLGVNYTGWLYNATAANFKGTQFDTSAGRGTFVFRVGVGQVIAGWDQGVVGMRVGGKRTLIIPSALGYGAAGAGGGAIPPNAALVFDVELLAVQ
jgi:FKBP-type peptidyl-prolyl cis-trans isomerase FkpA